MTNLQISQENTIVRDTVWRRCQSVLTGRESGAKVKGETFDLRFGEFDDVYYHLQAIKKQPAQVTLSLALPEGIEMPVGAEQAVSQAYDSIAPGVVKLESPCMAGYHLTLTCDLDKIQSTEQGELFVSKLAMLRSLVQGMPLRKILSDLQQGKKQGQNGIAQCIKYRQDRSMYVKPLDDSVVVVFPVHFEDENDSIIAVNFLQHFAETKRTQQALANSPSCTYHLQAPLEVSEALKSNRNDGNSRDAEANGGYMSFVLFSRHVSNDAKVDLCAWKMCTFYAFINYHIKASKGHIQRRMRTKADEWLDVLAKAKATPPKKQPKTVKLVN